ncbi:hypothetical protein D4S03_12380 [bacterium]|nr:MAG: hypothetical protein D4S03_12380 [bacterium]
MSHAPAKRPVSSRHRIDLFVMFALPLFSFILALVFHTNFLISTILFFGLPSIYLSVRNSRVILKTSIFAFLFSVPLTFILDYLLVRDSAWYIVRSAFPFRLFEAIAVDQFFWGFLCIYFIISMYEYFFDRRSAFPKERLVSKPTLIFGLIASFIAFMMIGMILVKASIPVIPYAYAFFGVTIVIIPLILFLWHFPHFYMRFIKITIYFFLLSILVEYVGLSLHHWIFPGFHYIWKIDYLGFSIPIEEFIFYFILSTPGLLAYYEYLDDDRK